MIVRLRGQVVEKTPSGAVLECAGVGYGVAMSLASLAALPAVGAEAVVWVHTHVSQDSLRLFGFSDLSERSAFEILIATSGVGPRLALAILSAISPWQLADAVTRADKATLTRIPGVGGKKAERLLVDLKGRLDVPDPASSLGLPHTTVRADLLSALANLGFDPHIAERAAEHALTQQPQQTELSALVRVALRSTTSPLRS